MRRLLPNFAPTLATSLLATSLLAATVTAAAVPCSAAAQNATGTDRPTATPADAHRISRVDSVFAEWTRPGSPGAAVAVLKDGEIVLERGYGLAQLEHEVPVTPTTVFHVASVSKQFTAFAIALLEGQGKLSVDDDVRLHIPEFPDLGERVTLRHLIHHTSGVRDQWELLGMAGWRLDDVITKDHVLALMRRQQELNFPPGSEYLYSNMGYTLLAEVVERVSGRPFPEFLREQAFEPLEMTRTHMHDDHEHVVPGRAYSYRGGSENGWRNAVLSYANAGATSLFTTAGDLARWLRNFETAQVGGPDVIERMRERGVLTSGDTISYAFAIGRGEHRGRETWSHGGADAGFRSFVLHVPEERLGVVVVSNVGSFNSGRMAHEVADLWLGDAVAADEEEESDGSDGPEREREERPDPSPEELAAYAGTYYSPELDVLYHIVVVEGRLEVRHHRLGDIPLMPGDETDEFGGSRWPVRRLVFTREDGGTVDGFRLSGGRVRNLRFVRLADGVLPGPVITAPPQARDAAGAAPAHADRIARIESSLGLPVRIAGRAAPTFTLRERMEHHGVPGVSVAVIDGGEIAWAKAYGVKDVESGEPVTPTTLFQAASISKPVTAVGLLTLVEEGRLDLDEDVNRYLASWSLPGHEFDEPVTLRRLLSHTAGTTVHGFPGYARTADRPSTAAVLRGEGNTAPVVVDMEPGSEWRYSGGGTTIVQQVLEDVTGRPLDAFMADAVLGPVGMTSSTYAQPLPPERWADAASGHRGDGSTVEGDWHVYPEMAAAGLWTTPTDLARLALEVQRALGGDTSRVLSPATTALMLEPVMGGYGLGFGTGEGADRRFGHGGANAGFRATLTAFYDRGQGVAVMANSDRGGSLAQELLMAVAAEYGWAGIEPTEVEMMELAAARLRALAGSYRMPERSVGVDLEATDDGLLRLSSTDLPPGLLVPVSETELVDLGSGLRFTVEWDGEEVSTLTVQGVELVPVREGAARRSGS